MDSLWLRTRHHANRESHKKITSWSTHNMSTSRDIWYWQRRIRLLLHIETLSESKLQGVVRKTHMTRHTEYTYKKLLAWNELVDLNNTITHSIWLLLRCLVFFINSIEAFSDVIIQCQLNLFLPIFALFSIAKRHSLVKYYFIVISNLAINVCNHIHKWKVRSCVLIEVEASFKKFKLTFFFSLLHYAFVESDSIS